MVQTIKNLPAMQETQVRSLGQEDPLEKGMATHSSILVWRIHGQRSLVGYSRKDLDMTEGLSFSSVVPLSDQWIIMMFQISSD